MPVLKLCQKLIQCASVTPKDEGCQAILIERLKALGFTITPLPFGDVANFWATHGDSQQYPPFVFAGHTDVVPAGKTAQWDFPPYEGVVHNGYLYGRGTADMKGALAAMVIATEQFLNLHPDYKGSIGFLITGDEEGPGTHGTRAMMQHLKKMGVKMGCCLLGEPTSDSTAGDVLKIGRRGSFIGRFKIQGKQGHVAYPHRAQNPIHYAIPFLQNLLKIRWDPRPSKHFPPTAFQIVQLEAGLNASNVIPGECHGVFSFRFSNKVTAEQLQQRVESIAALAEVPITFEWTLSGEPFLTEKGQLLTECEKAIQAVLQFKPSLSTDGGTSDGRFIAPEGIDVIELGLPNEHIHAVNERVSVKDLNQLAQIYQRLLVGYFI